MRGLDIPVVHLPYFVPELFATPTAASTGPAIDVGGRGPYFLYVGRLERIKGLHTLLPVFRRYRRARLLVAGAGADEPRLRQTGGGDDQIEFLGRLSHEQLRPLYRQAAAVIVPSICYEVSPMVMFEAFQQETPVIARNRGGMPAIVAESGGGWAYDSDEDLIAAMDQALAEPDRRNALGRQAYQMFSTRWTPAAHIESYFQLIARLREGGPAVSGDATATTR